MQRCGAPRVSAMRSGRLSMSSRWISMSLSRDDVGLARAAAALTVACTALTSDDLPMPRAPHKSALLAGNPRAKRSVFSKSRSRTRSIPFRSDISTRLTREIGANRPGGCQTKASAASKSGLARTAGARRSSAAAIRPAASGAGIGSGLDLPFRRGFLTRLAMDLRCLRSTLSGTPARPQGRLPAASRRPAGNALQLGLRPL